MILPEDEALLRQMAVDIAIIRTKLEENEKLNLAARVSSLECKLNEIWGGKTLLMWLATTGIAIYAALK